MSINIQIFPIFPHDTNGVILDHWKDHKSLGVLSGVSKHSYQILNNEFFKARFFKSHPTLADKKVFQNLQCFYPNYCWKVACCFYSNKLDNAYDLLFNFCLTSCFKGYSDISHKEIPTSAFIEALPNIQSSLTSKKEKCQIRIKELNGSYYGDSNGLLSKAWEAYSVANQELDERVRWFNDDIDMKNLKKEALEFQQFAYVEATKLLKLMLEIHSEDELPSIKVLIEQNLDRFLNGDILNDDFGVKMQPMIKCHFPIYLQMANFAKSILEKVDKFKILTEMPKNFNVMDCEVYRLDRAYKELENEKGENEKEVSDIQSKLDVCNECIDCINLSTKDECEIPSDECEIPCVIYEIPGMNVRYRPVFQNPFSIMEIFGCSFIKDITTAINIEHSSELLPVARSCISLISGIINGKRAASLDEISSIAKMINSFSGCPLLSLGYYLSSSDADVKTYIWGNLYQTCANGIQEWEWSEKHFHEFLPELNNILHEIEQEAEKQLLYLDRDLAKY